MRMLQIAALVEAILCWVAWSLSFVQPRKQAAGQKEIASAPASKVGIFMVMLGFACVWAYIRPEGFVKSTFSLVVSMILAPLSVLLVWAAAYRLGKQWRFQAAVSQGHELIQSGPYRWVRHPIYASMLALLVATGAAWTWWPMLTAAVVFFLIGTEIRIRAEDRLLAEHFQQQFTDYRSRVFAYIPFIR